MKGFTGFRRNTSRFSPGPALFVNRNAQRSVHVEEAQITPHFRGQRPLLQSSRSGCIDTIYERKTEIYKEYELIEHSIDSLIAECSRKIASLSPNDEYEGRVRMIMKYMTQSELSHRCALLILEGLPEDDLRELFTDSIYDLGKEIYDKATKLWNEKHRA